MWWLVVLVLAVAAVVLSCVAMGGIFTDISNYLATDDGLIVTWYRR